MLRLGYKQDIIIDSISEKFSDHFFKIMRSSIKINRRGKFQNLFFFTFFRYATQCLKTKTTTTITMTHLQRPKKPMKLANALLMRIQTGHFSQSCVIPIINKIVADCATNKLGSSPTNVGRQPLWINWCIEYRHTIVVQVLVVKSWFKWILCLLGV